MQKSLIRSFIINLDELHRFRSSTSVLRALLSQRYVNVRLPYEKHETIGSRIASFVGNTNTIKFLSSAMGYSRWICIEIDSISYLDDIAEDILEKSWAQAYHLYKLDEESGELSADDWSQLKTRSDYFTAKSREVKWVT